MLKTTFFLLCAYLAVWAAPNVLVENIDQIPDYYQRDRAFGGFPGAGAVYCGPVAVSNSLYWFAQNGYSGIIDITEDSKKDQHKLIKLLGSEKYINTGSGGSSPDMICIGIRKFMNERNYISAKIRFYGWRPVPEQFRTGLTIPELSLAKESLSKNNAVWLNIGWYDYNEKKKEYKRTGGHWVTFVGYGHDGKKDDSEVLIIHDPETRWRHNDYIRVQKIDEGMLTGKMKNLPQKATGYYCFPTGYKRYGIIEGMIVLEMPTRSSQTVSSTLIK